MAARRRPKLADDPQLDALLNEVADAAAGEAFPRTSRETVMYLAKIFYRHFATNKDLAELEAKLGAKIDAVPQRMLEAERRAGPTPEIQSDPARARQHGGYR